jgi:hypothetical protein
VGQNLATRLIADVERSDSFRGLSRDIKEISPQGARRRYRCARPGEPRSAMLTLRTRFE